MLALLSLSLLTFLDCGHGKAKIDKRLSSSSANRDTSPTYKSTGKNIASIAKPNNAAILNANGKLGSYFPVSIALIVCRETCKASANSACDQPRALRNSFRLFCIWIDTSVVAKHQAINDAPGAYRKWKNINYRYGWQTGNF